jgi:hypothetical protein
VNAGGVFVDAALRECSWPQNADNIYMYKPPTVLYSILHVIVYAHGEDDSVVPYRGKACPPFVISKPRETRVAVIGTGGKI